MTQQKQQIKKLRGKHLAWLLLSLQIVETTLHSKTLLSYKTTPELVKFIFQYKREAVISRLLYSGSQAYDFKYTVAPALHNSTRIQYAWIVAKVYSS